MLNKKTKVAFAIFLSVLIIGVIRYGYYDLPIKLTNEQLNADDFKLLMTFEDIEETLEADYDFIYGFGCDGYEKKDKSLFITLSGYPDVLDPYFLTGLTFYDDQYSIFDITIGMIYEAVQDKIPFKYIEEASNDFEKVHKRGRVSLSFYLNEGIVSKIKVTLMSSNKKDVVF